GASAYCLIDWVVECTLHRLFIITRIFRFSLFLIRFELIHAVLLPDSSRPGGMFGTGKQHRPAKIMTPREQQRHALESKLSQLRANRLRMKIYGEVSSSFSLSYETCLLFGLPCFW
ncbi:hypothetical protein AHF37_08830, partial [Paragonimus kellicotti]